VKEAMAVAQHHIAPDWVQAGTLLLRSLSQLSAVHTGILLINFSQRTMRIAYSSEVKDNTPPPRVEVLFILDTCEAKIDTRADENTKKNNFVIFAKISKMTGLNFQDGDYDLYKNMEHYFVLRHNLLSYF
jgi:hypothetical protein